MILLDIACLAAYVIHIHCWLNSGFITIDLYLLSLLVLDLCNFNVLHLDITYLYFVL